MNKEDARKELAENLMLLAESLLDGDAGEYSGTADKGQLKVTSATASGITVIAVTNWDIEEFEELYQWADYID